MPPISPAQLLELLRTSSNGTGLPIDADNIVAVARLVLEERVELGRDENGRLRVRLKRAH